MRPRLDRERIKTGGLWNLDQIKTMFDDRKTARLTGRKSAEIKGQTVTQQLSPDRLVRRGGFIQQIIISDGIMAEVNRLLARGKRPDRIAIGPPALCKQQVQLCGIGTLRQ